MLHVPVARNLVAAGREWVGRVHACKGGVADRCRPPGSSGFGQLRAGQRDMGELARVIERHAQHAQQLFDELIAGGVPLFCPVIFPSTSWTPTRRSASRTPAP